MRYIILSCKLSSQDTKKLVAFLKVCGFTLKHMVRDMKRIYSQIYMALGHTNFGETVLHKQIYLILNPWAPIQGFIFTSAALIH